MPPDRTSVIPEVLRKHESEILAKWLEEQRTSLATRGDLMPVKELHDQSRNFLRFATEAVQAELNDTSGPAWADVRELLQDLSRSRAHQGFTPSETATFILSLKQPLFMRIRREIGEDADALMKEIWRANLLLDRLALYTTEIYQKGRDEVITRQQEDMLELSTPVVQLWQNIVALPLIGTLDSARTQVVMESLLTRIVETGASTAIIDITGVPTVDTLVAQHLLKTVAAARLMGADCIISGIRPQIAQTIVHLGVELGDVITKATLADAFALALQRAGMTVTRIPKRG
jgi:rsbT co-antagonist protein RsbR